MRRTFLASGLGCLALALAAAMAGGSLKRSEPVTASTASLAAPATTAPSEPVPAAADDALATAPMARPVGAALIAPPPVQPTELERVAPRQPLGDLALAMPPKPGVPERTLLHRSVATAAGLIEAQGHSIALKGVAAVDPEESCQGAGGSSWPCGMVARTAFRNWLRGRAIECIVAEPSDDVTITECSLGGENVGLWLVENGFARAEPGGPYAAAEKEAQAAGRGIHGDARMR